MTQHIFRTQGNITQKNLTAILGGLYSVTEPQISEQTERYFDTFDLRLYKGGYISLVRNGRFSLFSREDGAEQCGMSVESEKPPRFRDYYPRGKLREILSDLIDVRALMALVAVHETKERREVQNERGKTIAHMTVIRRRLVSNGGTEKDIDPVIALTPLRGFEEETKELAASFRQSMAQVTHDDLFRELISHAEYVEDVARGGYPPFIEPTWSSCHAVKVILENLLNTSKEQEQGIIGDIDTEFLHDFRVSIRRGRVAVGQCRDIFIPEKYETLREALKTVHSATGPLRDIDVMLMDEPYYHSLVPEQLSEGLNLFFTYIRTLREEEHMKLVEFIGSEDYAERIAFASVFCTSPVQETCKPETVPIIRTAAAVIIRRFKKLRKRIDKLLNGTETIHEVRIDCKKLRYLLEFFSQLFPGRKVKRTIKNLKKFQNSLGDLHDIKVQQQILMESLDRMQHSEYASAEANAAIGGIVTVLSSKEKEMEGTLHTLLEEYRDSIKGKSMKQIFSYRI